MSKGLILDVYRCADGTDCTNNGVSAWAKTLLLVGNFVPEIFEESPDRPVVRLATKFDALRLVPDCIAPQWKMFGGNFAWTSDSRFGEILQNLGASVGPVKIYDRVEYSSPTPTPTRTPEPIIMNAFVEGTYYDIIPSKDVNNDCFCRSGRLSQLTENAISNRLGFKINSISKKWVFMIDDFRCEIQSHNYSDSCNYNIWVACGPPVIFKALFGSNFIVE